MSRFLSPGTPVRLINHLDETWEVGVVVHCWLDEEIGAYDCYVAFFGDTIPAGRPAEKPYVLRYASTSLTVVDPRGRHMATAYVYIATSKDSSSSYVDVSQCLLEMQWIAKYGVDDLVWFEGYADRNIADQRVADLRSMSEAGRRDLIQRNNPDQVDLSPRIWGSDPN
jgi:hypothetical protein